MDQMEEVRYVLQRLNIGQFKQIPHHMVQFHNKALVGLRLNGNEITELPLGIFDRMKNLKILDLSGNYIKSIPHRIFNHLHFLEELDLSHNNIKKLEYDVLTGLNSLEELNLQFNKLEILPDKFFEFIPYLTALNLSNNELSIIPSSLQLLTDLEWIDLSSNNLPSNLNRNIFLRHRTQEFLQKINR